VCESPETTRASFRISVLNQKGWKNHHYVSDSVKQFQNYSSSCINYWGDPKFISKTELNAPSNGICVEDKIIIRVELTIYGALEQYIRTPTSQQHVGAPPRRRTILDDLSYLLTDESLADVTIVAPEMTEGDTTHSLAPTRELRSIPEVEAEDGQGEKDGAVRKLDYGDSKRSASPLDEIDTSGDNTQQSLVRIPAHKFILSLRSPVFRAMFQADMSEAATSEVLIQDFEAEVMKEFVRFLYTDRCERPALEKHAEQLLAVACKYQVPGLETLCENHLCASLGVSNVVGVLYLADLYNAQQLKARALHFIAHNAKEVVQSDGFFQSLSFGLCQEVIRALAGVESSAGGALDGHHGHLHSSLLPSPSSDSSPGKPFLS
jgi:speckle-type POZ protein